MPKLSINTVIYGGIVVPRFKKVVKVVSNQKERPVPLYKNRISIRYQFEAICGKSILLACLSLNIISTRGQRVVPSIRSRPIDVPRPKAIKKSAQPEDHEDHSSKIHPRPYVIKNETIVSNELSPSIETTTKTPQQHDFCKSMRLIAHLQLCI